MAQKLRRHLARKKITPLLQMRVKERREREEARFSRQLRFPGSTNFKTAQISRGSLLVQHTSRGDRTTQFLASGHLEGSSRVWDTQGANEDYSDARQIGHGISG